MIYQESNRLVLLQLVLFNFEEIKKNVLRELNYKIDNCKAIVILTNNCASMIR